MTLEKIIWLDACEYDSVDTTKLDLMEKAEADGTGFLSRNTTYGKVYKVYDKVLVLVQDETEEGEKGIYAIPRNWIISPKKYRNK